MKKLILSVMVMMISLTMYSQEKTPLEKTIDGVKETVDTLRKDIKDAAIAIDTSSVSRMVYKDAKEAIVGLAGALKVGTEHVYEVLVKQQVVKAIVWAIVDFLILFFVVWLWLSWMWDNKFQDETITNKFGKSEKTGNQVISKYEWWGVPLIMTFVLIGFFCFTLSIIVTGFVNPEYGAMQDIMDWVSQIK